MMSVARAGSTTAVVLLIFAAPPVRVSSPAASPEFTTTLPFAPAAALVVFSVKVPLPEHDASALAIGGTSFEGLRSAVNTNRVCGVGDGLGVGDGVGEGAAAGVLQAASSNTAAVSPESKRMDTSSCTAVIRAWRHPG